jgi:hypothetical protein
LVAKRAPEAVAQRVEETLEAHEALAQCPEDLAAHRQVAYALEALEDELRGRGGGTSGFYERDRLGLIRTMDPITIEETIDDRRVKAHINRYESRARRAQERLKWFFQRAGVEPEDKPETPPWEQPYAEFESSRDHVLDE